MKRPARHTTASPPPGEHKLRIIAGRWRGRTLAFSALDGLRPTGSRIRETLFNWLAPDLPGSRCLDLFAGSGILGLEALSRGAAHCVFVERQPAAAAQLRANAERLGAENCHIEHTDALRWLQAVPEAPFDAVFIDPPFAANLWQPVAAALECGWLAEGAWIYLETPLLSDFVAPVTWRLHRQKTAGQVCYRLYERLCTDTVQTADSP